MIKNKMTKLNQPIHKPVLLNEAITSLSILPNGTYVDATSGFGGHSKEIYKKLNEQGKLICIDQDLTAINTLKQIFNNLNNVFVIYDNFANIKEILKKLKVNKVNGILADLGVSSLMFDDPKRGFSYHNDEKLDMRMNQNQALTAYDVVNKYSIEKLTNIFIKYADATEAKKVANAIGTYRKLNSISTTMQLVDIIKNAVSLKTLKKHKHPAKIYFQAIRMEVNDELNKLDNFINAGLDTLAIDGIMSIISYHSIEDRCVKTNFNRKVNPTIPIEIPLQIKPDFVLINKHPITPTEKEIKANKRSHSAKLRSIKRIKEGD